MLQTTQGRSRLERSNLNNFQLRASLNVTFIKCHDKINNFLPETEAQMWVKMEIIIPCIHVKSQLHPCGIHTFTEKLLLLLLSELDDEENLVKH